MAKAGFDRVNEQRARIALSQLGDALAPTNTLLGNPAAMRQCFETGGASTLQGLRHILDDWAQNGGLPAQVDKRPFRVGDNLGATDGAVMFRNDQAELIQYTPRTGQVLSRPLLIVPPQINKFYLFDLAPGRSLIEYLLANGIQVFVVSWRNPTAEQSRLGARQLRQHPGRTYRCRAFDHQQPRPEPGRCLFRRHHRVGHAWAPRGEAETGGSMRRRFL